jgi:transcriptional regulator with XRE-family HTH domain
MTLRLRLTSIRLGRNMTQKELADQALTTKHTIMRLEMGK